MNIEQLTDQAMYEAAEKLQPQLIEAVKGLMDLGLTAKQVERAVFRKYGHNGRSAMLSGIAHYLENNKENKQ